jgi:UDP-N-acetyl-D-mannosaminuronate dehydrogenase
MAPVPNRLSRPPTIASGVDQQQARPGGRGVLDPVHAPLAAVLDGADVAVIVTEWDQFRALDLDRGKKALTAPVRVDLRDVYRPKEMRARGFRYSSIGRG